MIAKSEWGQQLAVYMFIKNNRPSAIEQETLAKALDLSARAVEIAIRKLIDQGLLRLTVNYTNIGLTNRRSSHEERTNI